MLQTDVNWDDPALKRWLGSITRDGTRYNYRTAFRAYSLFIGMSASALIDEALEDIRKDPRERRDVVLTRLVQFYKWLRLILEGSSKTMEFRSIRFKIALAARLLI